MAKKNRRNLAQLLKKLKPEQLQQMQQMLGQMGLVGPGVNQPGLPPGAMMQQQAPPVRVNNPNAFFGGQQPINPGAMQGTMGMQPISTPRQTVQQQQFAKQQQGGGAPAGAGGAPSATPQSVPMGNNNNLNASANTTPAISSPNYGAGTQFGAGPMTPGVTTEQLQSAISDSPVLGTGPATAGQIFQAQYNPLINMAGRADIMNQLSTPGRSNVGGQYGTGGFANTVQQMAATDAANKGVQGAQGLIAGNVQQQLGAQQLASQFDTTARQQHIQHLNAMLQPAAAGAASGFGQAIQGMTKMPQFLG